MRVLVTRPIEDANPFAETLRALGHDPLLSPLLEVQFEENISLDLTGVQALLFTSANGARAFGMLEGRRDLPVFAVGDATARMADQLGFHRIHSASGDVPALAELVGDICDPSAGTLLHPAASIVAGDLQGFLGNLGFQITRHVLYRTHPVPCFSNEILDHFRSGRVDCVTLFSPRTAKTFVKLVIEAGLEEALKAIYVLSLSSAVAEELSKLQAKAVRVAKKPNQEALLAELQRLAEQG